MKHFKQLAVIWVFFSSCAFGEASHKTQALEVVSRALLQKDNTVLFELFLKSDRTIQFVVIATLDVKCDNEDGSRTYYPVQLSNRWGAAIAAHQAGLLFPGQWVHRAFVIDAGAPLERTYEGCRIDAGIDSKPFGNATDITVTTVIEAPKSNLNANDFDLEQGYQGHFLELDRTVNIPMATVNVVFQNKLDESVSIRPRSKFIYCPGHVTEKAGMVQWFYPTAKAMSGMQQQFLPPSALGVFSDVITFDDESEWAGCSLIFRFYDGHDSEFQLEIELSKAKTGFSSTDLR